MLEVAISAETVTNDRWVWISEEFSETVSKLSHAFTFSVERFKGQNHTASRHKF